MENNSVEIERKWLLLNYPQTGSTLKSNDRLDIEQFYNNGLRYRQTIINGVARIYERIKKVNVSFGVNNELDVQKITNKEYYELLESIPEKERIIISKTRILYYDINQPDLKFEVDDFYPSLLITLEVELPSIDFEFEMPKNIQSQIIMEVTGVKGFSNFDLAKQIRDAKNNWS